MNVEMTFRLELDLSRETVKDFQRKYESFKRHVEAMQLSGTLPIGDVKWVTAVRKRPIALLPAHTAGERLAHGY